MKKLIVLSLFLVASSAHALISGGLGVGIKNAQISDINNSSTLKANELAAYVHLDPIPLIPIAFGVAVFSDQYSGDTTFTSLSNVSIVPEIKAWFPFGNLRPYVRAGYLVYSNYTGKETVVGNQEATINYRGLGYRLGAGLTYSILPLIKIFAEVGYSSEEAKPKNFTVNDVDQSTNIPNLKILAQTGLIGVDVGI